MVPVIEINNEINVILVEYTDRARIAAEFGLSPFTIVRWRLASKDRSSRRSAANSSTTDRAPRMAGCTARTPTPAARGGK
jgi:hypothetical protein